MNIVDNDMSKVNKIMAGAGIAGTVIYAIADMFLYIVQDVLSDDQTALWDVPEWRLHSGADICHVCKNHGRVGGYEFAGESS